MILISDQDLQGISEGRSRTGPRIRKIMHNNNRSHPLLEQVPLTVSPFVSLPTATTLSYNYKTMPSNIPPSSLGIEAASDNPSDQPRPKYVVSGSGHAAHPEDIIASCRALQAHVSKMQEEAERELREFNERIQARELAEKRRVAPGWLDSETHILQPERSTPVQQQQSLPEPQQPQGPIGQPPADDQGAELDRAFGGMALR
ncbi:hypothetical protein Neosp_010859 [[Neocosmospora] mangrovei]